MGIEPQGVVRELYIHPEPAAPAESKQLEVEVSFAGFTCDRHSGLTRIIRSGTSEYQAGTEIGNTRQISILSCEEIIQIAEALQLTHLPAELLKPNLVIEGLEKLSMLPTGTRLHFSGGVTLVVDGYNPPCLSSGKAIEEAFPQEEKLAARFVKAAHLRRGIVAWVEHHGTLRVGETVRAVLPDRWLRNPGPK
jgi:MOSC domain-containing protein YiiM